VRAHVPHGTAPSQSITDAEPLTPHDRLACAPRSQAATATAEETVPAQPLDTAGSQQGVANTATVSRWGDDAGMSIARFNFSHGSHAYHQETLDNLRTACDNVGIMCAVLLDTKGPEIRTGFLKDGKPVTLLAGQVCPWPSW
jgi:hypothetical protein